MNTNQDYNNLSFDLPKNQSNVIKVIGVGGGGSNAINYMFSKGIKGVDYVVCNTDAQALENSSVPNKVQLGVNLTEGMGAGADPTVGEQAAIENLSELRDMLEKNTKMVFITAGMGGGTGTGAAPIISKLAMEMDILTVGIVTMPFVFEGKIRQNQANKGLEKLKNNCDSIIVVNNNKLRDIYGNLGVKEGFSKADEVLATAAKGIAEVITHHYTQNIDLKDAKAVLSKSGSAIMGSAGSSGDKRAIKAVTNALDSPLLNDNRIQGAQNVLLLILSGSSEVTIDEIGIINDYIQEIAGNNVNIIMGIGEDSNLIDEISVTVIATGFDISLQDEIIHVDPKKKIHYLDEESEVVERFEDKKSDPPLQYDYASDSIDFKNIDFDSDSLEDLNSKTEIIEIEDVRDIDVEFETVAFKKSEIIDERIELDFRDIYVNDAEIVKSEDKNLNSDKVIHVLEEDINDIEVIDPVQIIPYTMVGDLESVKVTDEINTTSENKKSVEDFNPFDNPIAKALAKRTEERKIKLKEFNYKFAKSRRVEDMEKEPAYKRAGIDLENDFSTEISMTKVEEDDNGNIELKSENSFLHDNVD
ncbi:MAG: cell division protein FtsZ [Bacteroidota bacterium]|nr:cell division protein FtsZ [Bacteroidota bacterium]MEC8176033.1 cell division protein FtsZ [Bacteroidota bacterium]